LSDFAEIWYVDALWIRRRGILKIHFRSNTRRLTAPKFVLFKSL